MISWPRFSVMEAVAGLYEFFLLVSPISDYQARASRTILTVSVTWSEYRG